MADSLPGCFSEYPNAVAPNRCETCPFREDCKRYVKREDVLAFCRDILQIIEKVERG